ncbi:MAG: thiamine-binding protein [Deltaproteobacteria bacterium]|nr:thiamine-binding protein [Deltaproteobacteria bacterium]
MARKLHELPFKMGLSRVYTTIQIDDRRDKVVHLGDKIQSVRNKMKKR